MKIRMLRTPGTGLLGELGVSDPAVIALLKESRTPVEVETALAQKLIDLTLAERPTAESMQGVAKKPEVAGVKTDVK